MRHLSTKDLLMHKKITLRSKDAPFGHEKICISSNECIGTGCLYIYIYICFFSIIISWLSQEWEAQMIEHRKGTKWKGNK